MESNTRKEGSSSRDGFRALAVGCFWGAGTTDGLRAGCRVGGPGRGRQGPILRSKRASPWVGRPKPSKGGGVMLREGPRGCAWSEFRSFGSPEGI